MEEYVTEEYSIEEENFVEESVQDYRLQSNNPPNPGITAAAQSLFMFPLGAITGAMGAVQS